MEGIELKTMEGICRYCGDIQPIMAMDQVDADQKVSENCSCGGAKMEMRKKKLLQSLGDTIGKSAPDNGFRQVSQEQERIITETALQVFHGVLRSATVKIDGSTIAITRSGEKTKVKRTDTRVATLEA